MSKIQVDTIVNKLDNGAPNFPSGATVTGVATATTLSVTGNATVSGDATISGSLTVSGTQTIINTTSLEIKDKTVGIGSTASPNDTIADGSGITIYGTTNKTLTYNNTKKAFETNIPWAPNETRVVTGAEKVTRVDGNTVNLVYSSSSSNVAICTNPTGNLTLNVTGIPTSSDFDSHSISFAVVSEATAGTAYSCLTVNLNNAATTIFWAGGNSQAATAGVVTSKGYTFYNFTGINTVGSASTTANYRVFGVVSGGFF